MQIVLYELAFNTYYNTDNFKFADKKIYFTPW